MRKIILHMSVSLDGYFEGLQHEIDWHVIDEELHQFLNDELRPMSAFLHGRVTYELMAKVWPTIEQDPASSPTMVEFGGIWSNMTKYVYSTTLEHAEWNSTIMRNVDPEQINELKSRPGGDMVVGGARIAETFRRLDLIDEYRIFVHPILLGRGRPLFGPMDDMQVLRLAETRRFSNGVVLLRYER